MLRCRLHSIIHYTICSLQRQKGWWQRWQGILHHHIVTYLYSLRRYVYTLTLSACLWGGRGGQWRHSGGGGGPRGSIGASAGHLRSGKEGEDHSYPRGKRLLYLQQHKPVRKTHHAHFTYTDTYSTYRLCRISCSLAILCLLCPAGFVSFATDSSIITSSPTSSWCSSCSALSHSLLRILSETSQLAIL